MALAGASFYSNALSTLLDSEYFQQNRPSRKLQVGTNFAEDGETITYTLRGKLLTNFHYVVHWIINDESFDRLGLNAQFVEDRA